MKVDLSEDEIKTLVGWYCGLGGRYGDTDEEDDALYAKLASLAPRERR